MFELKARQYRQVRPLFASMAEIHLCVEATLAGTSPGQVWVDNPVQPQVAILRAIEGHFLGGLPQDDTGDAALRERIPYDAELYAHPKGWEEKLDRIWSNPFVQRQPRQHYVLQTLHMLDWRDRIPPEFELVRIDEGLLERTHLENFNQVEMRVKHHWRSRADFLNNGFGFVLLREDTIVTRCMADCVVGSRCEIGIGTDMRYRRQGLAALTAAAAVEHCLSTGLTEIGWHCLANNVGSRAVAEKVGFEKAHDYYVLSSGFPAENAGDLAPEAWQRWARFYDRASEADKRHAYEAACAWALAGDRERPFAILNELLDSGWQIEVDRLRQNWAFETLHTEPLWPMLLDRLEPRPPE